MGYGTNETLGVEDIAIEKVSISDARKDLSKLVNILELEPGRIFELDRRDNPLALLLSFDEYSPIIKAFQSGNLKALLATFVVNKWLGTENIPNHLYKPQLEELNSMEPSQLLILSQAETSTSLKSLKKMGDLNEVLVDRLIKRSKIAQAIAEAEKNDLFEVAEHLTGSN